MIALGERESVVGKIPGHYHDGIGETHRRLPSVDDGLPALKNSTKMQES